MVMNTTTRPTLHQLIDQADGGFKALLAAEIMQKTNRTHGPVDGNCEVCGQASDSFTLQDWKSWHCFDCVVRSLTGEMAVTA